jgi:type IV pilus assembly protein PilW
MNTTRQYRTNKTNKWRSMSSQGFTLVELLVAMVVAAIAMGAIYSVYISVVRSYSVQRELAHMQQSMRAAMYLIKDDLRNSGREPLMTGAVGITNVSRFNGDADDASGYPGITMTSMFDSDGDGQADTDIVRTISYRVWDSDGDGRRELRRQDSLSPDPNAWYLVFDGIEDISFAYAFDNDNDMDLDRNNNDANATVVWGINTDNIVGLDTNADNIPDGNIDENDDGDGDGDIDNADGGLGAQIPLEDIRAVRIWLLARSRTAYPDYQDTQTYVLGHKVINMQDAANANRRNFRHKMLVSAVALNNHGRTP